MGQEYELKYRATSEALSSIRDNIGGFAEIGPEEMEAILRLAAQPR